MHLGEGVEDDVLNLGRPKRGAGSTNRLPTNSDSDGEGDSHGEDDGRGRASGEGMIDVHPTFMPEADLRGTVKVIVSQNQFWCHKEVLFFASPFFRGLLQGK